MCWPYESAQIMPKSQTLLPAFLNLPASKEQSSYIPLSKIHGDSGSERDHSGSIFSLRLPSHGPTARLIELSRMRKEALFHFQIRVESRAEQRRISSHFQRPRPAALPHRSALHTHHLSPVAKPLSSEDPFTFLVLCHLRSRSTSA